MAAGTFDTANMDIAAAKLVGIVQTDLNNAVANVRSVVGMLAGWTGTDAVQFNTDAAAIEQLIVALQSEMTALAQTCTKASASYASTQQSNVVDLSNVTVGAPHLGPNSPRAS